MNAILSLCHFCELHGPRVVFNTQAFRDPPSLTSIGLDQTHGDDDNIGEESEGGECCWKYGRINKDQTFKSEPSLITDTCSACRSFPHNKAAVISNDDENHVTFVSSQYPFQEEIFTLLRQAGIRSLSCEVYSEREGPIYFGDHARGHVISYTFFLKDIQARGFLRRYSILVMMADKMFLLNSWSFFIKYIQEIIKLLQDSACKVYSVEEKQESHQMGLKPPVTPDNSKRHRAAGNPRPLTDLVGDKNIWTTLHSRFTWILKAGGLRLLEKLVEGPPLFVPEEDQRRMPLQSLMEIMTPKNFQKLLHHIYIGNKVIFESSDEKLLSDIPLLLKSIMPLYLFHPLHLNFPGEDSKEVENVNIITVWSPSVSESSWDNFSMKFTPLRPEVGEEETKERFLSYDVQVSEPFPLKSRPPQIVPKILALIENKKFSISVLNLYFATLIDDWTNKVKIWSYVNRNKDLMNPQSQSQNQLSPVAASPSSHEKRGLLSRSPSPSPSAHSVSPPSGDTNILLTVVGALECDIPMLSALSSSFEKFGICC